MFIMQDANSPLVEGDCCRDHLRGSCQCYYSIDAHGLSVALAWPWPLRQVAEPGVMLK